LIYELRDKLELAEATGKRGFVKKLEKELNETIANIVETKHGRSWKKRDCC